MPVQLDHLILAVNDIGRSVTFYGDILGFSHDGETPPFAVLRVNDGFTLQLAPWGTKGGEHLAFAMTREEFDATFGRIRASEIPFGGTFSGVGSMQGPGVEVGARGPADTLYFFDPDRHLIEIRHYGD